MRHNFIGHFGEEAPFSWLFERGGAILLGKFGRRLVDFFYLCSKLCWMLAGVSFYGPCSTWRAGHLDQVILLVWPYNYIAEDRPCPTEKLVGNNFSTFSDAPCIYREVSVLIEQQVHTNGYYQFIFKYILQQNLFVFCMKI